MQRTSLLRSLFLYLCLFKDTVADAPPNVNEYESAVSHLRQIEAEYQRKRIYTADNIENNLIIPPYDPIKRQYNLKKYRSHNPPSTPPPPPQQLTETVLPLLEISASKNNPKALITLGDLYLFGNYSLPTDYHKAKNYYEKALEVWPDAHAYFMLGFIHSTGLFGEFPVDQKRANLYYQVAAENGDINALQVVAYRNLKGIGVPSNCELALPYLSRLSMMGFDRGRTPIADIDYNIRVSDFNGGLYGEKLSETVSSIDIPSRKYADIRTQIEEQKLNANDHEYATFYYNGLEHLRGDYFTERDFAQAFREFQKCVAIGEEYYGSRDYSNVDRLDRVFLSLCQVNLGRMYLEGLYVEKDASKAQQILQTSLKVKASSEALNQLGIIEEQGLVGEANRTKAMEYYTLASKQKRGAGSKNLAKSLMETVGTGSIESNENRDLIYKHMQQAAYYGSTEALYYVGNFLESGLAHLVEPEERVTCAKIALYYREFMKRLTSFYAPHLKYAFDELASGNFGNALVGYSIAAEQGYEQAQVSAAHLLYQVQPLYTRQETKTFTHDRLNLAIQYLDRASKQGNVDATILLGDIYKGQDGHAQIEPDYERAFNYYRIAADKHSSHGAFKLAEMYEYGLGSENHSVDYFLAKRYYDQSLQYKEKSDLERQTQQLKPTYSSAHINWALLRLRFKHLFNRNSANYRMDEHSSGWFSALKSLGKKTTGEQKSAQQMESLSKADAHHYGTSYDTEFVENYDVGDYLVITLTFIFFLVFFIQNIIRQVRRMRNGNQERREPEPEQQAQDRAEWNGNQFHFRRGNFEFHFFAI
ncbi:HRD3 [Candida theae]|uniref:HRD3 n=1 Tax=Candida theae TaxID=1198502 RepID=A0AAD5BH41_9ASCO|nr:HRD3 [Candida theae]KAI5962759.1 HRD3 [Candida theae]